MKKKAFLVRNYPSRLKKRQNFFSIFIFFVNKKSSYSNERKKKCSRQKPDVLLLLFILYDLEHVHVDIPHMRHEIFFMSSFLQ